MVKRLTVIIALLSIISTTVLSASLTVRYPVRGTRGRRLMRHQLLIESFRNDKLRIYKKYGFPRHRIRVRKFDSVTEHWKYYKHGVEFVFDEEGELVETDRFWPENRRERFQR